MKQAMTASRAPPSGTRPANVASAGKGKAAGATAYGGSGESTG